MPIQIGETIPSYTFRYSPYDPEAESLDVCTRPTDYSTDQWKGKKVLVVSVPGAFTGVCHEQHIPPFIINYEQIKAKGVDIIAVVAANDAWVMSAWGKTLGFKDKYYQVLGLSDPEATWSKSLGYGIDLSKAGMGTRTGRWYLVLDDLKVVSTAEEPTAGVTVTGADEVLAKL